MVTPQHGSERGGAVAEGFSLIEVVTALAIVSITLLPLFSLFLSANSQVNELGRQLASFPHERAGDAGAAGSGRTWSAWSWSVASVEAATWQADGLRLQIRVPPDLQHVEMGWWVDGWFEGVCSVDDTADAEVVLTALRGVPADADIVVRLRAPEGAWGVPWRLGGDGSGPPEYVVPGSGDPAVLDDQTLIVVHGQAAGLSRVIVTPQAPGTPDGADEWPAVLVAERGRVEVECDGRTQKLRSRSHGPSHLFF